MLKSWHPVAIGLLGVMIVFNIIMTSLGLLGLHFGEAIFVMGAGILVVGYVGFQWTLRKP